MARRIWGWYFFDWASQPYATLGLTFVFGPYFTEVAAARYLAEGAASGEARAQAQALWSLGQTMSGLAIAVLAPILGAWAGAMGRRMPWIAAFSVIYVLSAAALWQLTPDGSWLVPALVLFSLGFVASESAQNFANAYLPSLGDRAEVGRLSGSGAAFGYWGGVLSLIVVLLFLAENGSGRTLLQTPPALGLDPEMREGTRSVGPFIALWYLVFILPFFLWVRDVPAPRQPRVTLGAVWARLKQSVADAFRDRRLGAFLLASMLYRDAMAAIYAFGGVYAGLVLGWSIIQIGIFGIVGAITAAIVTWLGGLADRRFGPMLVIRTCVWMLIVVCLIVVGMSRDAIFGVALAPGSILPDAVFYVCGAVIGGAGGALYSASRTMVVRLSPEERITESFGLFALTGRATAFLAPALIGLATWITVSNQLGFLPVIPLFLVALWLLRFADPPQIRATP